MEISKLQLKEVFTLAFFDFCHAYSSPHKGESC